MIIPTECKNKSPVTCTQIKIFPTDGCDYRDEVYLKQIDIQSAKKSEPSFFSSCKLRFWKMADDRITDPYQGDTKLYKKRFWMLFLFCVCSMMNGFEWIQYSIISNIIECYHGVDAFTVNWTSTIFMVTYLALVFPASWFISRFDIKVALLTGSLLNCLSTAIQCASLDREGFPIALGAQAVAAVAQTVILPLPPRLAALWFGAKEVGRATAVGVLGAQFGVAIGFLLPPMIISNDCSKPDEIRHGKGILAYTLCATNLINFLMIVTSFQTKPPTPPSESSKTTPEVNYKKTLISLAKNYNFLKLLLTFGLLTGVTMSIGTLLNQILSPLFKDSEKVIGWIGITTNLSVLVSSFLAGYILDATHKFKETSLSICLLGAVSTACFTGLLFVRKIWVQFLTVLFSGFILNSYYSVGYDFAVEITYPEPEGITAGIMSASTMVFSILIIMLSSHLLHTYGILPCCLVFCSAILLACITAAFINSDLRRQEKNSKHNSSREISDRQDPSPDIVRTVTSSTHIQ